jgi:GntR family transcriptional regulator, transcriptional repressor for pyruvate dehydrogenase complex
MNGSRDTPADAATMPAASGRPAKTAMIIAQRIVADVARDRLSPGASLPPERMMLETYEVGRGTLREALRFLEFQGVITLKPGPRGGPVLSHPDASHLSSTLMLLMQLSEAPFRVLVEVRSALDPLVGRLAAARMSNADLAELGKTVTQMSNDIDDQRSFLEANKRFHDIIAWSSGNTLFGYIADSMIAILDGTVLGIDYPGHRRAATLNAHREIFDALQSKDEDASEGRMREHIDADVRFARLRYPELLEQVVAWDRAV